MPTRHDVRGTLLPGRSPGHAEPAGTITMANGLPGCSFCFGDGMEVIEGKGAQRQSAHESGAASGARTKPEPAAHISTLTQRLLAQRRLRGAVSETGPHRTHELRRAGRAGKENRHEGFYPAPLHNVDASRALPQTPHQKGVPTTAA